MNLLASLEESLQLANLNYFVVLILTQSSIQLAVECEMVSRPESDGTQIFVCRKHFKVRQKLFRLSETILFTIVFDQNFTLGLAGMVNLLWPINILSRIGSFSQTSSALREETGKG